MNYAEVDYLLGRVLKIGQDRWRVLRIVPGRDKVYCLNLDTGLQGEWSYTAVLALLQQGLIALP